MQIDKNTKFRLELFDKKRHNYKNFNCGVDRLDNYLIRNASKQHMDDMIRVYVALAVEDEQETVLGYVALNVGEMDASSLIIKPRGTPAHNKIPVLFLSRIASDLSASGNGIGGILIDLAFRKTINISNQAGCYGIILDVLMDGGEEETTRRRQWYESYGFQSFPSDINRMFMTTQQILEIQKAAE